MFKDLLSESCERGSNFKIPRTLKQPLLKVWAVHKILPVSGYRSIVDTGPFGDVTFISSTCIWIQVTCGFKSIS